MKNSPEYLQELKDLGFAPSIEEVPKFSFNRSKYNRMNGKEQDAYALKLKETKTDYQAVNRASFPKTYVSLPKLDYDYFASLFNQPL